MFLFSLFIFNKISSFLTLISQLFVFFPNLFIKLYLCLIQNGLSLKLLTYRLCFGFFSSLSFMKIWNLMRFRHLWIIYIYIYIFFFLCINIITPLHILWLKNVAIPNYDERTLLTFTYIKIEELLHLRLLRV